MKLVALVPQNFTSATASVLFTSVGFLCEFGMVPDVQILLPPQVIRKEKCTLLPKRIDVATHLTPYSSKRFNPLSVNILLCLGNTSKKQGYKIIDLSLVLLV